MLIKYLIFIKSSMLLFIAPCHSGDLTKEHHTTPRKFQTDTPCNWQVEIKTTNTWLQRDQNAIKILTDLSEKFPNGIPRPDYERANAEVDLEKNKLQSELDDLVQRCGWPSQTAFGTLAGQSAFLIVQHASTDFQLRYMPVIQEAAEAGELPKRHWAILYDRIAVAQGRPQRYGSQICMQGRSQSIVCGEIESISDIDARRASVGMIPASWCSYLSMMDVTHSSCVANESRKHP
ncbi:DUF6624 domain-containing protein [Roseateles sp. BYS180W]|uniref:DUF6624 domain-containing protein n=1 Tax=Roseateles rivi TaxID=3299028 RepID=A0ABW7FYG7_9BURK